MKWTYQYINQSKFWLKKTMQNMLQDLTLKLPAEHSSLDTVTFSLSMEYWTCPQNTFKLHLLCSCTIDCVAFAIH